MYAVRHTPRVLGSNVGWSGYCVAALASRLTVVVKQFDRFDGCKNVIITL